MNGYPKSFDVFKKNAAAKFVLIKPTRCNDTGRILKNGAVLLELAKAKGEKSYDWQSKLLFAFGMNDIVQFNDFRSPKWGSFFHKNDQTNKKLEIRKGEGKYEGTFMMHLSSGDQKVSIPLTGGEFKTLITLFNYAIPKIIGW